MNASRWYIDIDGTVAAPYPAPQWGDSATASVVFNRDGERSKLVWAPTLIRRIESVVNELDIELVLLSQWADDAEVAEGLSEALGGLYGVRLGGYTHEDGSGLWKPEALISDQASDPRPFIWTDDVEVQAHSELVRRATAGTPSLFISPSMIRGLTPTHLSSIEAFAAQHRGTSFNPLALNRIEPSQHT
jgi:hypothetical protein